MDVPKGVGLSKDLSEAIRYYKLAASQGHEIAQLNLGLMFFYGHGTHQDNTESLKWFRAAAAQVNPRAQYYLALLYHDGAGVRRDLMRAYICLSQAASNGEARAFALLETIEIEMEETTLIQARKLGKSSIDYCSTFYPFDVMEAKGAPIFNRISELTKSYSSV